MRIASVDIGTNTVRLLVVEVYDSGSFKWLMTDRAVVRLGEGLSRSKRLRPEAMERTLRVLERFKGECRRLKVDRVIPIATAAVREAENGDDFVRLVRDRIGWDVRVISGEEEAYYTYLGVKKGLSLNNPFLVFDIGGGSTEYICASDGLNYRSLGMGVVKLTEEFLVSDPPVEEELERLREAVRGFLGTLDMDRCRGVIVVGTAGTPTTLAALDMRLAVYDPEKVHGYRLSLERLESMERWLVSMTSSERLRLPGMEKGREDLIVAGTVIVVETLKFFGSREMVVSEWGIREGVIVDVVEREGRGLQGAG